MNVFLFLGIDTKHMDALGDYLLRTMGLKVWSGGDTGLHYTAIIALILFLMTLSYVNQNVIKTGLARGSRVFLVSIVLLTLFSTVTSLTAQLIKSNSHGLLAIELVSVEGKSNYQSDHGVIEKLESRFTLKNLSKVDQTFYMTLSHSWPVKYNDIEIKILDQDGQAQLFSLKPGQQKSFDINDRNYDFESNLMGQNRSSSSFPHGLILKSQDGQKIGLSENDYFGSSLDLK